MTIDDVMRHLAALEKSATPGPWMANDHELYYGPMGARGVHHQQISSAADAALIAVMRSWLVDLLNECQRLKDLAD